MRRLIIDCEKKQEIWRDLTPQEEAARLAEIEAMQLELERQRVEGRRKAFLRTSLELREMRQNRDVFSDVEIAEKQAELDGLR